MVVRAIGPDRLGPMAIDGAAAMVPLAQKVVRSIAVAMSMVYARECLEVLVEAKCDVNTRSLVNRYLLFNTKRTRRKLPKPAKAWFD